MDQSIVQSIAALRQLIHDFEPDLLTDAVARQQLAEKDRLLSESQQLLATVRSELQSQIASERASSQQEAARLNAEIRLRDQRIRLLELAVEYDPQLLKSSVFRKRITADDWLWLEDQFAPLATRLKAVKSVSLQAAELLAGIAIIKQHPDCPISPGEWGRILAPAASKDEAYIEDEDPPA